MKTCLPQKQQHAEGWTCNNIDLI